MLCSRSLILQFYLRTSDVAALEPLLAVAEEAVLLLSRADVAVFAAEVMHHHTVGIPGKRTEKQEFH